MEYLYFLINFFLINTYLDARRSSSKKKEKGNSKQKIVSFICKNDKLIITNRANRAV